MTIKSKLIINRSLVNFMQDQQNLGIRKLIINFNSIFSREHKNVQFWIRCNFYNLRILSFDETLLEQCVWTGVGISRGCRLLWGPEGDWMNPFFFRFDNIRFSGLINLPLGVRLLILSVIVTSAHRFPSNFQLFTSSDFNVFHLINLFHGFRLNSFKKKTPSENGFYV